MNNLMIKDTEYIDKGHDIKSDQVYIIWLMIAHARDALHTIRKRELKKYGITPAQAGVLLRIKMLENNATPAELARWSFRKPNSMTIILRRMVQKGLITKTCDQYKKNLQRISLTEKGEAAFQSSQNRESLIKVMSGLTEEQLEQLQFSLQTILQTAGKRLKNRFGKFDYTLYR